MWRKTMTDDAVAESLRHALADTYALYGKTHGYHWNVVDARFSQLHALFEEQYTELWGALDEMAERIRARGTYAPQGFGTLANLSSINGGDPTLTGQAMIEDLIEGHRTVIAALRTALSTAEDGDDPVTVDVLTGRLAAHEKHAWTLRATAGKP
jgi:starvation-inducible DNA-binding protein